MRRTKVNSKLLKQVILKSKCDFNYGSVCFTIYEETSTYESGNTKTYLTYTKQDSRNYTSWNHKYADYIDEVTFNNAIKRYKKKDDLELTYTYDINDSQVEFIIK